MSSRSVVLAGVAGLDARVAVDLDGLGLAADHGGLPLVEGGRHLLLVGVGVADEHGLHAHVAVLLVGREGVAVPAEGGLEGDLRVDPLGEEQVPGRRAEGPLLEHLGVVGRGRARSSSALLLGEEAGRVEEVLLGVGRLARRRRRRRRCRPG